MMFWDTDHGGRASFGYLAKPCLYTHSPKIGGPPNIKITVETLSFKTLKKKSEIMYLK